CPDQLDRAVAMEYGAIAAERASVPERPTQSAQSRRPRNRLGELRAMGCPKAKSFQLCLGTLVWQSEMALEGVRRCAQRDLEAGWPGGLSPPEDRNRSRASDASDRPARVDIDARPRHAPLPERPQPGIRRCCEVSGRDPVRPHPHSRKAADGGRI